MRAAETSVRPRADRANRRPAGDVDGAGAGSRTGSPDGRGAIGPHGVPEPAVVVDPLSGQQYRLITEEVYKLMQGVVRPLNRGWDSPEDDDLIRKDT